MQLLNGRISIQFGLLVKIEEGISVERSRTTFDEGDVLVSKPNSAIGGVVQYTWRRSPKADAFVRRDYLTSHLRCSARAYINCRRTNPEWAARFQRCCRRRCQNTRRLRWNSGNVYLDRPLFFDTASQAHRVVSLEAAASLLAVHPSQSFFDERQVALVSHGCELISTRSCPCSSQNKPYSVHRP